MTSNDVERSEVNDVRAKRESITRSEAEQIFPVLQSFKLLNPLVFGAKRYALRALLLHHSNTPSLQYSITPITQ